MLRYRTGDVTRARSRALPLRPDHGAHGARQGAHRRHARHQGRQRLSLAGRGGAADGRGAGPALPARRGPAAGASRRSRCRWSPPSGVVRGLGRLRRRASPRSPRCAARVAERLRGHLGLNLGDRDRAAQDHPAQRGQGGAGGRKGASHGLQQGATSEGQRLLARIEAGERIESADGDDGGVPREPHPSHDHAGRLGAGRRLRLRAVDHEGAHASRRSTWSPRS